MSGRSVDIAPRASALIASLRGLGYSPEAALADLVDNSITAGGRVVEIDIQWNNGNPVAAILDDGRGMPGGRVAEAMRLGGRGPANERDASDLGRFGMGLKTASLSQCRSMTVVTKVDSDVNAVTLDVDVISERGWIAVVPDYLPEHPYTSALLGRANGTLVLWERIDELSGLMGLPKEAFFLRLEEIRAHLGMVFHRFIGGDATKLSISLNKRPIRAWDPFQIAHPATQVMPIERVRHAGSAFTVKPYVLPHRDRYANEAEYEAAGGPGGWGARQGFYVYRGKRLLVAGSWLGLGGTRTWTRDEASRLARIAIDLPVNLDTDWRIDVRKSQARPPGAVRARLTDIAGRCRQEAREVFAFRGQGPRVRGESRTALPVWIALPGPKGTRYRINREHPVVAAYRASASSVRALDALLSIVERSVPVERIWLDASESEGAEHPPMDADDIEQLSNLLLELNKILPATMSLDRRIEVLLLNLPGDLTKLRAELARKMEGQNGGCD